MMIQTFPSGPFQTNAYVIACVETKDAAIIDPAPDSKVAITHYVSVHDLNLKMILLTHSHWDHIADAAQLKEQLGLPVFVHELDAPNLQAPGSDGLPYWIPMESVDPDHFLKEGDLIEVGKLRLKVIHTPGHTPGGVSFFAKEEGILFSGDTLFKGSIGNLSFPTSLKDEMWPSLRKLAKLPKETRVYPGHGQSTTIGNETWLENAEEIFGNY